MYKRLEGSITRAAMFIKAQRIAFILLFIHDSSGTKRFINAFRLYAKTAIHHHAAFSPKSPEQSTQQLIYKHAISTISPGKDVSFKMEEAKEDK